MNGFRVILVVWALCIGGAWSYLTPAARASAAADIASLFEGAEVRPPGSPGNLAMEARIAARFGASGFPHGEIAFPAPVFRAGEAWLNPSGLPRMRMYAMHPTVFRPGNFHESAFGTSLVYLGRGTPSDLLAVSGTALRDALVVMEFDCGDRWERLLRFGIRGIVFLAADRYCTVDAHAKVYATEVDTPRYFLDAADSTALRDRLRTRPGLTMPAAVEAQPSTWENRQLRDLWVIIPGTGEELGKDAVLITAPIDANCVVPDLARGAQNGANLYLLLKLLDTFSRTPPTRTVILAAVNAHTANYLGERMLSWSLLAPRPRVEEMQDVIADDLREEEMLLGYYRKLSLDPPTEEDGRFLIELRDLRDSSTGRNVTVKEPIVDLARREVNRLKSRQLHLVRENLGAEEMEARRKALEEQRSAYVNVLTLFNKVGIRTVLSDLGPDELEILRSYVNEIIESRSTWARLNQQELDRIAANTAIRSALGPREVKFALCLDLDWTGTRIGFSANNQTGVGRWPHKWGLNAARVASTLAESGELRGPNLFVDAMTKQGGLPEGHFFPMTSDTVSVIQAGGPTPAFALRNVFGNYGRAFAPDDTFENLSAENVEAVVSYVPQLVRALLADHAITVPSELIRPTGRIGTWSPAWGVQVRTFKYDDFAASVLPQLPVPGSAIVLQDPADANRPPLRSGDVVTGAVALTDARASWIFYGLTARSLFSNAFHYDPTFTTVDHAIDAGEAELKMSSTIYRGTTSRILALFRCREFPIYARENTSAISVGPITEHAYKALSGRLNAPPKKYGMAGVSNPFSDKGMARTDGPAAVYLEPGERLKLLTTDKVLALRADSDEPEGTGFLEPGELGPDFFATAVKDMSALNHERLRQLRGTSDELARIFLERGDEAIATMQAARTEHRYVDYLRSLYEALGAHGKAYGRMTAVTNDMLKAVVFYLALMLPFCFFVEKLLFKFKRIEQEMVAFGGLFVLTFIVFRSIHPAFRIAQAPEAIFVAFVMGGLGAFVIKILHGRFEGEMQLLFKTYPGMSSGTVGYSIVGQEAMLIGVNNMKRRRIRTTLTTATVVLVTFTMLAFTSISRRMSPTIITKSKRVPYTGVMYHWPGNSRMDEATTRALGDLFAGRGDVIVRRWLLPPKSQDAWIPYRVSTDSGAAGNLDGVLGLPAAENGFLAPIPMRAGRFFTRDDAAEVVLPTALARSLGITPDSYSGRTVRVMNRDLEVVGIVNDDEFRLIKDLNQRPLMPIKSLLTQQQGQQQDLEAMAAEEDEGESGVFYVDMSSLLIMPVETARTFGAEPYSVSVRLHDQSQLWPVIDELLTVTNASKFYVCSTIPFRVGDASKRSTAPGVYYIGEGYRTSIGGLAFLIIPLLISSTIILNTMLGSVFERKAEIAIYNAVGLNPTHIGMFFLAESFVYSVIGSVGGYLIGQVAAIALTRTGLVSEINLNFSSLSVVYVIVFTVAVVLLSTLYPCMVATKAAVPSGKRKWSLPDNDGNTMDVVFPFIYQPDLILGLMGYLADYFGRFTEASFGDLIAENQTVETGRDDEGRPTYQLRYNIALAPFDLGVTQRARFQCAYDARVQAYRIRMHVARASGQDTNWTTTNKPFLERLRTYLLHWRNLQPGEHAAFVLKGQDLFSERASHAPDNDRATVTNGQATALENR